MGSTAPSSGVNVPRWSNNYYQPRYGAKDWEKYVSKDWKPYMPQKVTTGYQVPWGYNNPRSTSTYKPYQFPGTQYDKIGGDVMNRIRQVIQSGGYSPEQKQAMYEAAMTPVREEAQRLQEQAQNTLYSRGLGHSGVMQRAQSDISQQVLRRAAEVSGGIEQASAENAIRNSLAAIQAYQQGQASDRDVALNIEQMKMQNALANAQLEQQRQELMTQTGLDARRFDLMMGELAQAAYMNDVDRSLKEAEIKNKYNLDAAQLELAKYVAEQEVAQARRDWWSHLISTIIGGTIYGKKAGLF